jgi:flagella basal body P-ring formation protein FlgA
MDREDVRRAVSAALPAVVPTARSASITSIRPAQAPPGDLAFPPAGFRLLSSSGGYCSFLWDGSLNFDGTRRMPVKVLGRYQAETVRLAARHDLRAGDVVTPSDYDRVVEPGCPTGNFRELPADGSVMRQSVGKGGAIEASALQSPPLIEEGAVVGVVAQAGGASVRIHAIAERTGRRGESITVRNTENGKRIRVVITGAGEARVAVAGAAR